MGRTHPAVPVRLLPVEQGGSKYDAKALYISKGLHCMHALFPLQGGAAYRTFGYTTKHFIPRTTAQAMSDTVWGHFQEQQQQQHQLACIRAKKTIPPEVKRCPCITSYQRDYFDRFPAFRKVRPPTAIQ